MITYDEMISNPVKAHELLLVQSQLIEVQRTELELTNKNLQDVKELIQRYQKLLDSTNDQLERVIKRVQEVFYELPTN
jgi:hypothetical protein